MSYKNTNSLDIGILVFHINRFSDLFIINYLKGYWLKRFYRWKGVAPFSCQLPIRNFSHTKKNLNGKFQGQ